MAGQHVASDRRLVVRTVKGEVCVISADNRYVKIGSRVVAEVLCSVKVRRAYSWNVNGELWARIKENAGTGRLAVSAAWLADRAY